MSFYLVTIQKLNEPCLFVYGSYHTKEKIVLDFVDNN